MKTIEITKLLLTMGIVSAATTVARAQIDHGHLNAGAVSTAQNSKLIFANGADFAASSGYVKTLTFTNGSIYAGYYQGSITLTALPQTSLNGGPATNAPAFGSYIQAQLTSVAGPAGGAFAFWDVGATNPTFSLTSGQAGTNRWNLSQGDGIPGSDPYGHIHGRRFTATKPGIYTVGFKLFDTSTNGAGGGPIHVPSDVIQVYFQADINMLSIDPDVDHSHLRFSAPLGTNWQLQAATTLGTNANWTNVSGPVTGDDYFHEIEDDTPVQGNRYYRIKSSP